MSGKHGKRILIELEYYVRTENNSTYLHIKGYYQNGLICDIYICVCKRKYKYFVVTSMKTGVLHVKSLNKTCHFGAIKRRPFTLLCDVTPYLFKY